MPDHVYKKIEIVGSSRNGFEEAVQNALACATKIVRNMRWFDVTETRGYIEDRKAGEGQVTLKTGFTLDESHSERRPRHSARLEQAVFFGAQACGRAE